MVEKKIDESEMRIISKQLKNKEISYRAKAIELGVSVSTLHERVKKYDNQKSIFDKSWNKPNTRTPEHDIRTSHPNTTQMKKKIKPNTRTPEHDTRTHKTNTNQIKNKYKNPLNKEKMNQLKKSNMYMPTEFLRNIIWTMTGKGTRKNRDDCIDEIIKLMNKQKKISIKKPRDKNE